MAKKKLMRYEEIHNFPNVIYTEIVDAENRIVSRNWDEHAFEKAQDTVVEIGCGRGEYCIDLARRNPHKNYVGVDLKADRLYIGALKAKEEGLTNVMFVRIRVEYLIPFLGDQKLSEAWITFPDPYNRTVNGRKRLTAGTFLDVYRHIVEPGALLHLKTDDPTLYEFSLESLKENGAEILFHTNDLYSVTEELGDATAVQTTYEKRYIKEGRLIKYIRFCLN
ncbi:tRNA (guanosine(46)-N7)-methyltransferase TrmB [Desulfoluna spongiiphila]|uniref:tRNA (guanine-N(7)-)-methyltransferase n=1 Tax=Desulfoluna spongiiphila TaxID=419481 RepID=A0A1G5AGF3_9BACT|nr:tRNA (guanosine(46)-N7)-methyltransferase TrmB [Desulfoluna spongiiphila]SCX76978.1 tRNA (guanine-N(7)-)-methyltransferase [Desulfoluna spongiiphila]VVS90609.1 trna (guanine-n-7) methyltransferase trmb type [Desulfoluna spongiiphila]